MTSKSIRYCPRLLSFPAIGAGLLLIWLVNRAPVGSCEEAVKNAPGERKFRPVQVVVEPWKGQHHVYGLFKIPKEYKHHRRYGVSLIIEGIETTFSAGSSENEEQGEGGVESEFYTRRAYIPTRTALWFLLAGRFRELKSPCHWLLIYVERTL